jgi:hypothetical protein
MQFSDDALDISVAAAVDHAEGPPVAGQVDLG